MKKLFFEISIAVVLALFVCRPYFHAGFPYTHDGENHLARFANYKIAVKELQIPPRFAPSLMNRYGYPAFNYNYPLANILSLPFSFLKIHYILTFKILVFLSVFSGLFFIRKWLAFYDFKNREIIFSQIVFALNPYLQNLINYRGNIGEIMALNIIVICFYYLEKLLKTRNSFSQLDKLFFTLVLTCLLLSHNISAMFAGVIFVGFVATRGLKETFILIKDLFLPALTAALLSMWFWLPAIFEKSQIVLDDSKFFNEYIKHFPTLSQILFAPFSFGYSRVGSIDDLSFSLGLVPTAIFIVSLILLIKNFRQKNVSDKNLYFFAGSSILLIILQLEITSKIWQTLPLLSYLQFPWRLSLFLASLIVPLTAFIFAKAKKCLKIILILLTILQLIQVSRIKPIDYLNKTITDYDAYPQSTSSLNENLPKTFKYLFFGDWQPTAKILTGEGSVVVNKWFGSSRSYVLNLKAESVIVEPTMKYLGWMTFATPDDGNTKKVEYIDNEEIAGRIAYILPPGNYLIKSSFTQWTAPRIVGNSLFVLGIGLLLINFKKIVLHEK